MEPFLNKGTKQRRFLKINKSFEFVYTFTVGHHITNLVFFKLSTAVAAPVLAARVATLVTTTPASLLSVLVAPAALLLLLPHLTALVTPLVAALVSHHHALLLHAAHLIATTPTTLLHASTHLVATAPTALLLAHLVTTPLLLTSSHLHLGILGLGPTTHAATAAHFPVATPSALLVEATSLVVATVATALDRK